MAEKAVHLLSPGLLEYMADIQCNIRGSVSERSVAFMKDQLMRSNTFSALADNSITGTQCWCAWCIMFITRVTPSLASLDGINPPWSKWIIEVSSCASLVARILVNNFKIDIEQRYGPTDS